MTSRSVCDRMGQHIDDLAETLSATVDELSADLERQETFGMRPAHLSIRHWWYSSCRKGWVTPGSSSSA